jgi:Polyketide cyclase / dehydrase and lipid transport
MKYRTAAVLTACLACCVSAQTREHAEASIVLRLPAPPSVVFPLFGPVRESEWAPHWNPAILYPPDRSQKSGSVFTTRQHDRDVVWVLTTYDEAALRISYVVVKPARSVGQLDITLTAIGAKETEATVTHRLTSLSEERDGDVKDFAAQFPLERDHWQLAISGRLRELTGR